MESIQDNFRKYGINARELFGGAQLQVGRSSSVPLSNYMDVRVL